MARFGYYCFTFKVCFFFVQAILNTGCSAGGGNSVDALFNSPQSPPSVIEVPVDGGELSISISDPLADGTNVGYSGTISGLCGVAGNSIQISGDATTFTVCQGNLTWNADLDFSSAAAGTVTIAAILLGRTTDEGETFKSSPAVKTFNKVNNDCDTIAQRADTFGNFSTTGNGTSVPYTICNAAQLSNMRTFMTSNFEISNAIDFNNSSFTPINGNFDGALEGNSFKISNMVMSSSTLDDMGIFRYFRGEYIRNINFENVSVEGRNRVGLLTGRYRSPAADISNIIVSGSINGNSEVGIILGRADANMTLQISGSNYTGNSSSVGNFVGGLVGRYLGGTGSLTISNVFTTGDIQGVSYVGGIIGDTDAPLTISLATHTGLVNSAGGIYVGGIAGDAVGGIYSDLTQVGNVSSSRTGGTGYVGGIIGRVATLDATVTRANMTGDVNSGTGYTGGLFGLFRGSLTLGIFRGNMLVVDDVGFTLLNRVGGIVGYASNTSHILDSHTSGATSNDRSTITAFAEYVGGIAGHLNLGGISISTSKANIIAQDERVGGIVGYINAQYLKSSTAEGTISVSLATNYIGGAIGFSDNNAMDADGITFRGDISLISGDPDYVGGLAGIFDGINLSNSNSEITQTLEGDYYVGGLIGSARTNGVVLNNVYAIGNVDGRRYVAGLSGYVGQNSDIDNCSAEGSVTATDLYVGGLVGHFDNNGTMNNCQTVGNLTVNNTGANHTGGAIGLADPGTQITSVSSNYNVNGVSNTGGLIGYLHTNADCNFCTATGTVTGTASYIGGLVGQMRDNAGIADSSATGDVTGNGSYIGGLAAGSDRNGRTIDRSTASGTVINNGNAGYTGGLVGRHRGSITDSSASGNVTAGTGDYAGGLVGYQYTGSITNSSATGNVISGGRYVGGLAGRAAATTNSFATGDVNAGNSYSGGLIGRADGTTSNCRATGTVTGVSYTGGLVGQHVGSANTSYATGDVSGVTYIGGLLGYSQNGSINSNYATGNVTGTGNSIGGLIGYRLNGNTYDNFAIGNVKGPTNVGGLIGYVNTGAGTVRECYATGQVIRATGGSANDRFGTLAGRRSNNNDLNATNNYYNADVPVVDEVGLTPYAGANVLGVAVSNANMSVQGSFPGLDFGTPLWEMPTGAYQIPVTNGGPINYSFPILEWME